MSSNKKNEMISLTDGFYDLGRKQVILCQENPEAYVRTLVKFGSQRSVMISVYRMLVSAGKMPPIENLPPEKKREYWEQAKQDAAGTLPGDKIAVLARCFYCIDWYLLNQ